jgi:subtilisin family serine protease
MALRAVPDGDERDEDIARAIKYAADNGAKVINMSFGKKYSPNTAMVEEAIDYALAKDVLLVHAAGNEAVDIDNEFHYPRGLKKNKKSKKGFLTVGAHTLADTNFVLASFSNYGIKSVDVLAPGEDIYSTISGNAYKRNSGTSMAAPVVSGMAAVYRSLYPEKNANQIKKLIRKSIVKQKKIETKIGDKEVPLKDIVRYPGFIDFRRIID